MSGHLNSPSTISFLSVSMMSPNIGILRSSQIDFLRDIWFLTSPVLTRVLVDMVKIMIVICIPSWMPVPMLLINASSLTSIMLLSWSQLTISIHIFVGSQCISDSLLIIPKMIFPPVIKGWKGPFWCKSHSSTSTGTQKVQCSMRSLLAQK